MIRLRNAFIYCFLISLLLLSVESLAQAVKGESMRMHSISLTKKKKSGTNKINKPLICFVSLHPLEKADKEVESAFCQLKAFSEFQAEFLTMKELVMQSKKTGRFSVIWIHRPDTTALSAVETNGKLVESLTTYVKNGGKLLLTLQAVHYLNVLGYEPLPLKDSTKSCIDDGYGRKLGFHAFREHPLFTGLHGGAYLNRPSKDLTTRTSLTAGGN